jgi:hypothetical protein
MRRILVFMSPPKEGKGCGRSHTGTATTVSPAAGRISSRQPVLAALGQNHRRIWKNVLAIVNILPVRRDLLYERPGISTG